MESVWKEPTLPRSNPIRLGDVVTYKLDDGRVLVGRFTGRQMTTEGDGSKDEATVAVPRAPIGAGGAVVFTVPFADLEFESTGWTVESTEKLDRYWNEEVA